MTQNSKKSIHTRLELLFKNLYFLDQIKEISWQDLSQDHFKLSALLHDLYIIISCILDIGSHILVSDYQDEVKVYADVLKKLALRKIISKELYERNKNMSGFRNLLVRQYEEIDLEIVYKFLQDHLDDLKEFGEAFAKYVQEDLGNDK